MSNDKMDSTAVYAMFEELLATMQKALAAPENIPAPILNPEDRAAIERLTVKLNEQPTKLENIVRYQHRISIDVMSSKSFIWKLVIVLIMGTLIFVIGEQRRDLTLFRDNDLKYRYIRMKGEAAPKDVLKLREIFDFNRNPDSIKLIRKQVEKYEQLVREQAEQAARAKVAGAESERLKEQAETVKGGKKK